MVKSPLLNRKKMVSIVKDEEKNVLVVSVSSRKFFDIPVPLFIELHKHMGNKHRPVKVEIDYENNKIEIEKKYRIKINYKLKLSTIESYNREQVENLIQEIFENLLVVLINFNEISFYV